MIRRIWALGPAHAVEDLSGLQLGHLSNWAAEQGPSLQTADS